MVHAEYVFIASIHLSTTLVYTLIQKSLGVMKSEPMLTPREKSPLPEKKISLEEDRTHDAASSKTASPTHNQWAILAPLHADCHSWPYLRKFKTGWCLIFYHTTLNMDIYSLESVSVSNHSKYGHLQKGGCVILKLLLIWKFTERRVYHFKTNPSMEIYRKGGVPF